MSKIVRYCTGLLLTLITLSCTLVLVMYSLYKPKDEGTLVLPGINGEITITREQTTGIAHVKGNTIKDAFLGQGFAHAQTRLWQMEKTRRLVTGTMSELIGEKGLPLDKFSLTIGYFSTAKDILKSLPPDQIELFQAYCDGINHYINNIKLSGGDQASGRLWPLEFYALGINDIDQWTVEHVVGMMKLSALNLTWNWNQELLREVFSDMHQDIQDMIEEIAPFTAEFAHNLVTIIDEEDLREQGLILEGGSHYEKYNEFKKSQPKLEKNQSASDNESGKSEQAKIVDDILNRSTLDDQLASNNWVIHGDHTETGLPMLAADPHLSTDMPSFWSQMELKWGDKGDYLIGGSVPGAPGVIIGKTKHFTWGMTAPLDDISDLYLEKINEDETQYFVDGQWKLMKFREESINVKGQDKPVHFVVRTTHRGPILDSDIIQGGSVLFGGTIPKVRGPKKHFSFVWGGYQHKDNTMDMINNLLYADSVKDFVSKMESIGEYNGIPLNLLIASRDGDIGYMLLSPHPIRKGNIPHKGSMVQDGTTTEFDWTGRYVEVKDLPKVINPKKGFLVTANNRQVPDSSKSIVGISSTSPVRSQRITELIRDQITEGRKFTVQDMTNIQQDFTDMAARDLVPKLLQIYESQKDYLTPRDAKDTQKMVDMLKEWKGEMTEDSKAATVYAYWQILFFRTLFKNYEEDPLTRMTLSDNYPFQDFYMKMIIATASDPQGNKYNKLCKGYYVNYTGEEHCAYNVVQSLGEVKRYLSRKIHLDHNQWEYRKVHSNLYPAIPWSFTSLKSIFTRQVPTGGNGNTPHVSKYSTLKASESSELISTHTANYKQIVALGKRPEDDIAIYSVDTGNDGNLFSGHYFDMNQDHLEGKLAPMLFQDRLSDVKTSTLTLKGDNSGQSSNANQSQQESDL